MSVHSQGPTIINWGGNYIDAPPNSQPLNGTQVFTSGVDVDGDAALDDSRMGRPFSTSQVFSPTSSYGGVGGQSATFYGGAMSDLQNSLLSDSFEQMEIQNQGANDMISFRVQQGNHQHRLHAALYWDSSDFLVAGPVSFGATDTVSLEITNSDEAQNDAVGRWLVRQGGQFYLSEDFFVPGNGTYTTTGSALNADTWAVWNPTAAGQDMDFSGTSPVFGSLTLSSVTAVGFFIEHESFRDAFNFSVNGFDVTAQPVPEPGTWAAGLAVSLGVLGVWVRRNRRSPAQG